MREIKNVRELEQGKTYLYKGLGTITQNATYSAKVIGIFRHTITLELCIKQETMIDDLPIGEPKPYTWSICKTAVGVTEHLFEEGAVE